MNTVRKGFAIVVRRLRTQGLVVTLHWLWARGVPFITGVPVVRYSTVTSQLWVGPQYRRWGKSVLERRGVTAGVNLRIEFDDAEHGLALADYCHLPTIDDDGLTADNFESGVAFIREQVMRGGTVYIHCKAGVGRAPTMAAAYLIAEGMSADEAIALIRTVRPFITITQPQMEALRAWEGRRLSPR